MALHRMFSRRTIETLVRLGTACGAIVRFVPSATLALVALAARPSSPPAAITAAVAALLAAVLSVRAGGTSWTLIVDVTGSVFALLAGSAAWLVIRDPRLSALFVLAVALALLLPGMAWLLVGGGWSRPRTPVRADLTLYAGIWAVGSAALVGFVAFALRHWHLDAFGPWTAGLPYIVPAAIGAVTAVNLARANLDHPNARSLAAL